MHTLMSDCVRRHAVQWKLCLLVQSNNFPDRGRSFERDINLTLAT